MFFNHHASGQAKLSNGPAEDQQRLFANDLSARPLDDPNSAAEAAELTVPADSTSLLATSEFTAIMDRNSIFIVL